jgi:hypothetical protein
VVYPILGKTRELEKQKRHLYNPSAVIVMGSSSGIASTWEQRVDPWMILWPLVIMGIFGLVFLIYSSYQIIIIQQPFGMVASSILAAISVAFALIIGYVIQKSIDEEDVRGGEKIIVSKRLLATTLPFGVLLSLTSVWSTNTMIFYPETIRAIVLVGAILVSGLAMMIGLSFTSKYYNLSSLGHSENRKVAAYAVREGTRPSVVERVTNPIGGVFYMVMDSHVIEFLFKLEDRPLGHA